MAHCHIGGCIRPTDKKRRTDRHFSPTQLIFTPITNEFGPSRPPLLTLSQNIGLLAGATFWGFGCDIFGRRWAFNITLGLTALWGLIAGSAPSFAAIGSFAALWSFGVGGNLPVDSAIFLEFLPGSHQYLLTVLSVDWALAQLITTLVAWPLLGNMTCQQDEVCTRGKNMGWRYFTITMGGITALMFIGRFVLFRIFESPKYLMGKGRDAEAVEVVHEVARRNGRSTTLTLADLQACEPEGYTSTNATAEAAVRRQLAKFDASHVRALFSTRKLGLSTGLIMAVWALIGLGYPLYNAYIPYIQATRGADFGDGSTYRTYRDSLIIAVLGVPGALLGGWLVERRIVGRKGTLAISTVLTGVFLYCSTTAVTSDALLGWNCAFNFTSNVMYAVLYGFTPELFPTPQRGTGNALAAVCNRVFGIMAVSLLLSPSSVCGILADLPHLAHRRHVRQPRDGGARLHERRPLHRRRSPRRGPSLRVTRQSSLVDCLADIFAFAGS